MIITTEIYDRLQEDSCRFLRFNATARGWEEIGVMAARDKIGHSLRFANRTTKRRRVGRRPKKTNDEDDARSVVTASSTASSSTRDSSTRMTTTTGSSTAPSSSSSTGNGMSLDDFPSIHFDEEELLSSQLKYLSTEALPACGSLMDLNLNTMLFHNNSSASTSSATTSTPCMAPSAPVPVLAAGTGNARPASKALMDKQELLQDGLLFGSGGLSHPVSSAQEGSRSQPLHNPIKSDDAAAADVVIDAYLPLLQDKIMDWDEFESEISPTIFA